MSQFDIYRSFATAIASSARKPSNRPGVCRRLAPWMMAFALALVPVASHAQEEVHLGAFHLPNEIEIYTDVTVVADYVLILDYGSLEIEAAGDVNFFFHNIGRLEIAAGNPDYDGRSFVLVQTTPSHDQGLFSILQVDDVLVQLLSRGRTHRRSGLGPG